MTVQLSADAWLLHKAHKAIDAGANFAAWAVAVARLSLLHISEPTRPY